MAIETILADVGGVLIKNYDISDDIRSRVGLPEEVFRPLWKQLVKAYGSGLITENELWQSFANKGGAEVRVNENALAQTFEENLVVYEHVLSLFRQLGKNGYRLAILSDTNPNHAEVLQHHGIYDAFGDKVFLSHQIGVRKPEPKAFRIVLNAMEIADPSSVLFIDDRQTLTRLGTLAYKPFTLLMKRVLSSQH
jgi:putative hydrolase of the HAD superfamily